MVYEDNEEEYGDYYEYEDEQEDGQGGALRGYSSHCQWGSTRLWGSTSRD
jgi:hypothetical protein